MAVRLGLAWRIGALMASLTGVLVLAGIGAVWWRTHRLAGPALERAVLRAGDLVNEAVEARLDRLGLVARLMVNDSPFRAYVAEGERGSILDLLSDRLPLYACDAFVITDARGSPLVDTRGPRGDTPGRPVPDAPPAIVQRALSGEPASGVLLEPDGGLYLAAAAPLRAGEAAVLLVLEAMDAELVSALHQATGAELALFATSGARVLPGATTLPMSRSELGSLLSRLPIAPGGSPRRIEADGEEFVMVSLPLGDRAGFLALRSVDRELEAFRKIQSALLLVGLAALPIALAVGMVAARRITRPIAVLARATERVRAGDWSVELPDDTGDEVGALAGAFRAMIAQLRQKEDLDAWIGALAARGHGAGAGPADARDAAGGLSRAATIGTVRLREPAGGEVIAAGMILSNRFRIIEPLGAGGMGSVWKARDEQLGEFVAIKVLPADRLASRPELVERFRQEIRLARRVTHRNVLRTHELLEIDGTWAILMECVDGVPLERLLTEGRLPLAAALRIARQIGAGLEAAHAQGVVHRDLKPANIMVDTAGGVKIADFGLARAEDADDGRTREGVVLGTPQYMSPEQAMGLPADRRSDVYSAGVIFYELFCGRPPFSASSPRGWMKAHTGTPPDPPRAVQPALPAGLETVLLRALAKDPEQRYPSARELNEALARAASEGVLA